MIMFIRRCMHYKENVHVRNAYVVDKGRKLTLA